MDAKTGETCSRVSGLLHLHVEGELESIRENIVTEHLAECASCRREKEDLERERSWFIAAAVKSPPLPVRFRKRIIARLAERERSRARKRRQAVIARAAGIAAAAAIAFLILHAPDAGREASPAGSPVEVATALRPASGPGAAVSTPDDPSRADLARAAAVSPAGVYPVATTFVRLPNFGDVLGLAVQVAPPAPRPAPVDPCRPDPNMDGRTDLNDVAYSFQIVLGAPPPRSIELGSAPEAEPECEESCVRA